MPNIKIRLANTNDISSLDDVEISAAEAFHSLPGYDPDSGHTVGAAILSEMATNKKLWVATTDNGIPVGFIGCRDMNDLFYIHEISVAYKFQKQGIGRRLMLTVLDQAVRDGYTAAGLTTRRDAVWNMPFYTTLGFSEITGAQEWPDLFKQLQKEIGQGADPAVRCAMIKIL